MSTNELPIKFPLDQRTKEGFDRTFLTMKGIMTELVVKQSGVSPPDDALSEICQIFFFITINMESSLHHRYKHGIDLVNKSFPKQLDIFRNYLISVAQNSIERGVPKDYILPYLCFYFEDTHKKIFPNHPTIL